MPITSSDAHRELNRLLEEAEGTHADAVEDGDADATDAVVLGPGYDILALKVQIAILSLLESR